MVRKRKLLLSRYMLNGYMYYQSHWIIYIVYIWFVLAFYCILLFDTSELLLRFGVVKSIIKRVTYNNTNTGVVSNIKLDLIL